MPLMESDPRKEAADCIISLARLPRVSGALAHFAVVFKVYA